MPLRIRNRSRRKPFSARSRQACECPFSLTLLQTGSVHNGVMNFLRYIMSLSLVAWVGGIVFFVSMTPILFAVLPSRHLAGSVVSPALSRLHWIGMISGVLFLASSLLYSRFTTGDSKPLAAANILVALMLALTCISQF